MGLLHVYSIMYSSLFLIVFLSLCLSVCNATIFSFFHHQRGHLVTEETLHHHFARYGTVIDVFVKYSCFNKVREREVENEWLLHCTDIHINIADTIINHFQTLTNPRTIQLYCTYHLALPCLILSPCLTNLKTITNKTGYRTTKRIRIRTLRRESYREAVSNSCCYRSNGQRARTFRLSAQ